jgi:hypothetical protein
VARGLGNPHGVRCSPVGDHVRGLFAPVNHASRSAGIGHVWAQREERFGQTEEVGVDVEADRRRFVWWSHAVCKGIS